MEKHFAFDIDDTLTNSHEVDLFYLQEYLHTKNKELLEAFFHLPWKEQKPFWEQYLTTMVPLYEVKENAVEVLHRLKKKGFTLSAISVRGANTTLEEQLTYDYLKQQDIPVDHVILKCIEKEKACLALGATIMADDSFWVIKRLMKTNVTPLYFHPFDLDGIQVVHNWLEIENYLVKEEEQHEYTYHYAQK